MSIKSNTKRFLSSLLVCIMTSSIALTTFTGNVVNAQEQTEQETHEVAVPYQTCKGKESERAGEYKPEEQVNLSTSSANTEEVFKNWSIEGIADYDALSTSTEFAMSDCDVKAEAHYENKLYKLTIPNEWCEVMDGKTEFAAGETVRIKYKENDYREFIKWEVDGIDEDNSKTKELVFEMPAHNVNVEMLQKVKTYKVNLKNAILCSEQNEFQPGSKVKIKADEGKKIFVEWSVSGVDNYIDYGDEISFKMPAHNVNVEAILKARPHKVTVENGRIDSEKTEFIAGEEVTVKADLDNKAKTFYKWVISDKNSTTTYDVGKREITFTMPDNDVNAEAIFKNVDYTFVMVNGKATVTYGDVVNKETTGGFYPALETTVNIEADPDTDTKVFDRWEIKGLEEGSYDATQRKLEFTMPTNPVRVEAIYKDNTNKVANNNETIKARAHKVTVKNGEIVGNKTKFIAGEEVTVKANSDDETKTFYKWVISDEKRTAIYDAGKREITFTMPARDVTAEAMFKNTYHTFMVLNGKATVTYGDVVNAETTAGLYPALDTTINIVADPDTDTKEFDRWEIEGLKEGSYYAKERKLKFTMPANTVKAKAIYKDKTYYVSTESYCNVILNNNEESYCGDFVPGEKVTLVVDKLIDFDLSVKSWSINGIPVEKLEYVVVANKEMLTFTMPTYNIEVVAICDFFPREGV